MVTGMLPLSDAKKKYPKWMKGGREDVDSGLFNNQS